MSTQMFMSGLILGLLLGVLLCYITLRFLSRQRLYDRRREVDRLTEEFQDLFRQIDRDKNDSP
jgi:uncharacterized membrane-anchored protein YhcB (DUF1043 family)